MAAPSSPPPAGRRRRGPTRAAARPGQAGPLASHAGRRRPGAGRPSRGDAGRRRCPPATVQARPRSVGRQRPAEVGGGAARPGPAARGSCRRRRFAAASPRQGAAAGGRRASAGPAEGSRRGEESGERKRGQQGPAYCHLSEKTKAEQNQSKTANRTNKEQITRF